MPKRTEEYWQKRFEQILINNEKLALDYEKEMASIYGKLEKDLQKELGAFYQRYALETGLDLHEVKKQLNPKQLKNFKKEQELYLDTIHKLIEEGADLQAYEETLRKLSARAYVSKLQELQYNLNSQIMIATGQQQVAMTHTLGEAYVQGYFESVYALQRGVGMGYSFTVPNNEDVLKILKTPWNGNNYSKSIWNNKAKLTNWLNTDLPRHFAAGSSVQQMSQDLVKKVQTNYKNAIRLVRTETNYISNQSTMDAYEEQGVDRYQILATLDSRTSEICRFMDGKVFNTTDKKVSVNMPPFHVNCRTTTIPYFEDDDFEELERAARDEKGNYYTVPANMNYEQWNKKYGQGAKVKNGKTVTGPQTNVPVDQTSAPVEEREYVHMEQEDIDKWSDEVVPNLTEKQKDAVYEYTGLSYTSINSALRGKITPDSAITEQVDMIRSAMGEIPQDTRLFRVMNKYDFLKTFGDDMLAELQPTYDTQVWTSKLAGKLFKDKAFQSTSWTPKSSYVQSRIDDRSILFRIKTPKGTKALPVEKFSFVEGEKEIILNSGNSYIITGIKKTDTPKGELIMVDCLLHEGV